MMKIKLNNKYTIILSGVGGGVGTVNRKKFLFLKGTYFSDF